MNIIKLMQPGEGHWTDRADCHGDPRFTQKDRPHDKVCEKLAEICEGCPVLKNCLKDQTEPFTIGGERYEVIGTFVAGRWRGDTEGRDAGLEREDPLPQV